MPLRGQQLAFRHHEVYITYSTFRDFINGKSVELDTIEGAAYDRGSWVSQDPSVKPTVRADRRVVLAGHSFGGCTMVRPHATSFFVAVLIYTFSSPYCRRNHWKVITRYPSNARSCSIHGWNPLQHRVRSPPSYTKKTKTALLLSLQRTSQVRLCLNPRLPAIGRSWVIVLRVLARQGDLIPECLYSIQRHSLFGKIILRGWKRSLLDGSPRVGAS